MVPPRLDKRHSYSPGRRIFVRVVEFGEQPGAGEPPVSLGGGDGDPQGGGHFGHGEPGKEPEFHHLGLDGSPFGESVEGIVQGEEFVRGGGRREVDECDPPPAAPVTDPALAAGGVDEDATDGFGGGGEEVPAAVELLVPDEPEVRLVDEGGGVEGVLGGFGRHARRRKFPQLVVHEREQFRSGAAVTGRGGVEEAGHVGHGGECTHPPVSGTPKARRASATPPDGYETLDARTEGILDQVIGLYDHIDAQFTDIKQQLGDIRRLVAEIVARKKATGFSQCSEEELNYLHVKLFELRSNSLSVGAARLEEIGDDLTEIELFDERD